jgi:hypothetical protein
MVAQGGGGRGGIAPTNSRPQHYIGPPVPTGQEAGWASEPGWTQRLEEKSFASAGDQTWFALSPSP